MSIEFLIYILDFTFTFVSIILHGKDYCTHIKQHLYYYAYMYIRVYIRVAGRVPVPVVTLGILGDGRRGKQDYVWLSKWTLLYFFFP